MRTVGLEGSTELSFQVGEITGQQASLGFNLNFAPVLDAIPIRTTAGNQRVFARDPNRCRSSHAQRASCGRILSCGKHFPGHGDTAVDSHLGLPSLPHSRERLDAIELFPFRAAVEADLPCLMSAHIVFEELDPAAGNASPTVIPTLLRREMGLKAPSPRMTRNGIPVSILSGPRSRGEV